MKLELKNIFKTKDMQQEIWGEADVILKVVYLLMVLM